MTTETTQASIHPQLSEIIEQNIGNKLTKELAVGLMHSVQLLMNGVVQEAFAVAQATAQAAAPEGEAAAANAPA